jgi:hypothetical protein
MVSASAINIVALCRISVENFPPFFHISSTHPLPSGAMFKVYVLKKGEIKSKGKIKLRRKK